MAELPFDESVVRFKENEVRFDDFINDAVGYLTREGVSVESIQAFLARLESEITAGAALEPRMVVVESGLATAQSDISTLQGEMTTAQGDVDTLETQMIEVVRKLTNPSEWISYLPEGSNYTTPSFSAGVLTKLLIPTTVKFSNDFAIVDIGGGDFRVQYQGLVTRDFKVHMNTGLQTGASNTIIALRMYKGTVASPDNIEPGVSIPLKVGTGTDTGALGLAGVTTLNPLDVIAIAAETSLTSTLTFIETSILIEEKNG